jgi:hypothetical protein
MARANSLDRLEQEILQAKAEALGRAGAKLRQAVRRYQQLKAEAPAEPDELERARLEDSWKGVIAAREVLIVLREGVGLRSHDVVDVEYDIPLKSRGSR